MAVQVAERRVLMGYLSALGAAACYGGVAVIGRKIVNELASPLVATSFALLFGTIIVAALFHKHALQDLSTRPPKRAWLFVFGAGCASAWGVSFFLLALSHAPVVVVAPASGTSPLVALVLSQLFLRRLERITWRIVVGAIMVVGGVALVTIGSQ